jgi:hypothetical protein
MYYPDCIYQQMIEIERQNGSGERLNRFISILHFKEEFYFFKDVPAVLGAKFFEQAGQQAGH